jgi:asparagine synthase (glutamine-hydrolysing)
VAAEPPKRYSQDCVAMGAQKPMTAFAGIVAFGGSPDTIQTEEQIGRAITAVRKGPLQAGRLNGALFVQRILVPAYGGQGRPPPLAVRSGHALFAADARLDNRAELAAALAIPPLDLAQTPDSILILRAYDRWGEAGLARCLGAFAFALWDADAHRLILVRDCLGHRALFFHRGDGFVVFATTLRALLAMSCVPREIDEITLANFLALNLGEPRRTFYRGIQRVPSRTLVAIDRDSISHRHYWSPNLDAPPPFRREQDYVERARELFDDAVATAISDTPRVAIAASGGLDSSAIAATAARLGRAERITCYTLVPPAGLQIDVGRSYYLDERSKVEALARTHPALELRFLSPERTHPDMADDTRFLARVGIPILNPVNHGAFSYLYDAAAAMGHRALLVGNSGNFGLTWGGGFSLVASLRAGQLGRFARDLHRSAGKDNRGLSRALLAEAVAPAAPTWLRRAIQRRRGRDPDSVAYFSALNPAFMADHDLARRWREQGFDPLFGVSGWNAARHRADRLFDRNQFGRDFDSASGELYGLETRDPHADRRLLEFLLSVPEQMFRRNGVPRSFARAVLADRLPPEILDERRYGAQGVAWFRSLDARRQDIAIEIDRLETSPLASRMLDVPRLKRLMREWPADEHAAQTRRREYKNALARGVHVGRFIRWVEGGNA